MMAAAPSSSSESQDPEVARRRALKVAVCALCTEYGFVSAEDSVLETLTEMLQSILMEIGRSTRSYSELAGRTHSMLSDVVMAMVDIGINVESIPAYARRPNKTAFMPPGHSVQTPTLKTLLVGERKSHLPYIPDYMPPFPDPHTYIRTLTHKAPINEYQVIREKASSQKRDVERALTRFIAKTGETQSLFKDDVTAYPLIAMTAMPIPYLSALQPRDQEFESGDKGDSSSHLAMNVEPPAGLIAPRDYSQSGETAASFGGGDASDTDMIDNPYIRPVKLPLKRTFKTDLT